MRRPRPEVVALKARRLSPGKTAGIVIGAVLGAAAIGAITTAVVFAAAAGDD
jgi:hypothetical protein